MNIGLVPPEMLLHTAHIYIVYIHQWKEQNSVLLRQFTNLFLDFVQNISKGQSKHQKLCDGMNTQKVSHKILFYTDNIYMV